MFDSPDLVGDLEARLLAVERRTVRLDDDVRTLRRGLTEAQQRIWDGWAGSGYPLPIPAIAPTCVTSFPVVCGCMPFDIVVHDPYYGDTTMHYDSANQWWLGCKMVTTPAGGCASVTTPWFYRLIGSNATSTWGLTWSFLLGGGGCPDSTATCASTGTLSSHSATATINCSGTTSWFYFATLGFYPSSPTLTIHLPDGL